MENVEVTKIEFDTVRIPDDTKPTSFEVIVQDGVEGTHTVKTIDGEVVSATTVAPKNAVIYYGTIEEEQEVEEAEEVVSTSESPQEEVVKQPLETVETTVDPSEPLERHDVDHSQISFSGYAGILEHETSKYTTLKKAALELARLLVFAIPGILITVFTDNPELGGSFGAVILLILKSIDRGIHENKDTQSTGLLPF